MVTRAHQSPSTTQTSSRLVQRFCRAHDRDRQSDHATPSIILDRIYVHSTAMRSKTADSFRSREHPCSRHALGHLNGKRLDAMISNVLITKQSRKPADGPLPQPLRLHDQHCIGLLFGPPTARLRQTDAQILVWIFTILSRTTPNAAVDAPQST